MGSGEEARENSSNMALVKLADKVCCETLLRWYTWDKGHEFQVTACAQSCNRSMLIKYSILFSIAVAKILKTFE